MIAALWSHIFAAVGSTAALMAAAVAAGFYGRKATAILAAEAHIADHMVLLSARPSVRAVGVFRLRFSGDDGATIRVTEVWRDEDGLVDGQFWEAGAVFGPAAGGGGHFVEAGETLLTTVLFNLGPLPPGVVGWRVSFGINVERRRFGGSWSWADQVFVPVLTQVG